MNCWFGSAIDIQEKSAPTSIGIELVSTLLSIRLIQLD